MLLHVKPVTMTFISKSFAQSLQVLSDNKSIPIRMHTRIYFTSLLLSCTDLFGRHFLSEMIKIQLVYVTQVQNQHTV